MTLAKLQNPVRQAFDKVGNDLKEIHKGLGEYSKALERVCYSSRSPNTSSNDETKLFKNKPLPTTDYDALSSQGELINQAVGMHLLREGDFTVAASFDTEVQSKLHGNIVSSQRRQYSHPVSGDFKGDATFSTEYLKGCFQHMYYVLGEIHNKNLLPAIDWAREHSTQLEARGSDLEFELGRQQFLWLFTKNLAIGSTSGVLDPYKDALQYARQEFDRFQGKYLKEIQQLMGALVFAKNLSFSPYQHLIPDESRGDELSTSFVREFCSLLGLSADSPLYVASTAGAIALPTLLKLQNIMKEKRTEWTTQHELPVGKYISDASPSNFLQVEIPLPPSYQFHSIFVCPVSKEQATDENPPMMMPCGHVVAEESLQRLGKNSRFKCPYCPGESSTTEATKVIL